MKNIYKATTALFVSLLFFNHSLFAHTDKKEPAPRVHLSTIKVLGESEKAELFEGTQASLKLGGDELLRKGGASLGETLEGEVGIHSTQFGVSAGRPVIRGFSGDRVRILQNGIGLLDASGVSDDHAVPISALNSDSLEIVRGPLNLLYGASAVGGVLNVTNSRIHNEYFDGFSGAFDLKGDTVKDYRRSGVKLDYGANNMMFHFDGELSKSGLLDTPAGEVQNSRTEQNSANVGFTYFTENKNNFGVSYSYYDTFYGVVSDEDEEVNIDVKQERVDFAGNIKTSGFLKEIRLKAAQTFYDHDELEGDELGTVFANEGFEGRLELVQSDKGALSGVFGLQVGESEFSALGDEAFLPVTDSSNLAAFVYEKFQTDKTAYSLGLRLENADYDAPSVAQRDFFSSSLALGLKRQLGEDSFLDVNLSYTERAPTTTELFANGGHVATQTFELGDVDLEKEESFGLEVAVGKQNKNVETKLSLYAQDFDNYIALTPTGNIEDGLPEARFTATAARIYGAEIEALVHLNSNFDLKLLGDWLRAEDRDAGAELPRTAPARLSAELIYEWKKIRSNLEIQHTFNQSKVAVNESETDGFTRVNLGASYDFLRNGQRYALYGEVQNIFDEAGRNHVSFIKDRLQFPGVGVVVGLQGYF